MSIFIDRDTPIIVQDITGKMARFHTKDMINYGSNVVGGVVPGKKGATVDPTNDEEDKIDDLGDGTDQIQALLSTVDSPTHSPPSKKFKLGYIVL